MADEKTPDFVISGAADSSNTEEAEQPTVLNLAALAEAAEAADDNTVYALDKNLNAHRTMTAEQILAAIQKAVTTGVVTEDFTAFIEMIKEQNKGIGLKFWLGTTAQFTALEKTDADTVYFLTDSTSLASLDAAFIELKKELEDGSFEVKKAKEADNVKSKINDKNISEIFENDGLTVKKATAAGNAKKINDLEIKLDSNGVLKIGNIIIPQKKLLWSGTTESEVTITLNETLKNGDVVEFHYHFYDETSKMEAYRVVRTTVNFIGAEAGIMQNSMGIGIIAENGIAVEAPYYQIEGNQLVWLGYRLRTEGDERTTSKYTILTAIYKIIE